MFEDETAEFEEADLEGFEFIAAVKPKTDSKGKQLKGSVIDWESMRPAGGADEKEAKAKAAAVEEAEDDFEDITF